MSEEFLQHIFEPFSRANDSRISKISGTGLGMVITQSLVQMMGGEITVKSRLGEGSCFTVVIGLKLQMDEAEEESLPDIQEVDCSGAHILLVEDNELNQEIASEFIRMMGAESEIAGNGKEAVSKFAASEEGYYDLILMDILMPEMGGYEASGIIRSMKRKDAGTVPIFAMTANAFAEDIVSTQKAGMNAHVSKPIDFQILKETMEKLLKN